MVGEPESPSCAEVSIVDRVELGVPVLEEEPLIGDNDLARSKYPLDSVKTSTLPYDGDLASF